jgi:DNA repair exonuclease SbcCD nuclease subunit
MDYWALGHVHVRAVLSHERPLAIYPGNLQARHVNETGAKGFYLVDVEDGRANASFVEVGLVRFDTIHVDIAGLTSVAEVHSALTAAALLPRGTALTHVLRATLHGSGPTHSALHKAGEAGLLEYLADVAPAGVWWDEVRLRTRPELDRETRLQAGDFIADLLTLSDARRPNAAEHVATLVAELQSHPQLRNVADHLGLEALIDEANTVWDEAEIAAFDLIDAELAEG